MIFTLRAS